MELRIARNKANKIIRNIGFDSSHRMEALGFFGGIWLLWNDPYQVKILVNNNQFIHARSFKTRMVVKFYSRQSMGAPNDRNTTTYRAFSTNLVQLLMAFGCLLVTLI